VIPQFRPKLRYEFPSLMEFPFPNGRSPPFWFFRGKVNTFLMQFPESPIRSAYWI
jgi:hypothetical protein